MAALSPKARALIEDAREELRPPPGECERLEALLDAQLGAPLPNPGGHGRPPVTSAGGWRLMASLSVGVAVVGGAIWALQPGASQSSAPPPASATTVVQPPPAELATSAVVLDEPEPSAPPPAPALKPPVEAQAPAQRSQDRLALEVALLSRATSELRAGRSGAALRLLDEHHRKFPNGALAVERRAARAQTLCTLRRVKEGRAELSFLAPQSPAAGRAKQLCDAAEAASKR